MSFILVGQFCDITNSNKMRLQTEDIDLNGRELQTIAQALENLQDDYETLDKKYKPMIRSLQRRQVLKLNSIIADLEQIKEELTNIII